MGYLVKIKKGKKIIMQKELAALASEVEAKEWGRRQSSALGFKESFISVEEVSTSESGKKEN